VSPLFPTNLDTDTMQRLGPWCDGFVGTECKTNDLYEAYVTEGWRNIVLFKGAILTQDLTIAANQVSIWSPYNCQALSLGAHGIIITGVQCKLEGFTINGATGVGILISGTGSVDLHNIASINCGSHGIEVASSANDMNFTKCRMFYNGGDGLRIGVGAYRTGLSGKSVCYGNTGYGVNDLDDSSILVGNRLDGNTAGAVNGTPDVDVGNAKT